MLCFFHLYFTCIFVNGILVERTLNGTQSWKHTKRPKELIFGLNVLQKKVSRTLSSTSEDSLNIQSSSSVEPETKQEKHEGEQFTSPRKNSLSRMDSKQKGRNLNAFNPFAPKAVSTEGQKQIPNCLLQLTRPKEKKDKKKKKKSKSKPTQEAGNTVSPVNDRFK